MATLHIECEWHRDPAGYRLLPADEPPPPAPTNMLTATGNWQVGVAALGSLGSLLGSYPVLRPERVVRNGGSLQSYYPLLMIDNLFTIFSKTATTAEGVLDFIEKFGPLTNAGLDENQGEDVAKVIEAAEYMAVILTVHSTRARLAQTLQGRSIPLGSIVAELNVDPVLGTLRTQLKVPDLLTGLWVQLSQALSTGAAIRTCDHCGIFFEVGPGTGRRLDAKFCSDQHRVDFNSLRRSHKGAIDA